MLLLSMTILLCLSQSCHLVEAMKGIDVSIMLYDFDFKDFTQQGNGDFAILQGYRSNGSVNLNALVDSEEARAAGYDIFDVYMSPCVRCNKSASQQVQDMVKVLKKMTNGYGCIWLEVNEKHHWHSNHTVNRKFLQELLLEIDKHKPAGVYTSELGWREVMGESTIGSSYPLWYVHNGTDPSFDDFKPFGGWIKPQMKQYHQYPDIIGVNLDYSY